MSKHEFDSDGFQIIKRSGKNKAKKLPLKNLNVTKIDEEVNIKKAHRRILTCVEELQGSLYLEEVIKTVSNASKQKKIVDIVSFGLGHVGTCNISQYQLALLLCFQKALTPLNIYVHDPIFYTDECTLLKNLELKLIENNNEGNYVISDQGVTLVYLPHCPKQLTNNFLWSNWGVNLENCILLGNSFSSLIENHPSRLLQNIVPYIFKITPITTEICIENSFFYKDIFNDTSCHYFTREKLDTVPIDFWINKKKPEYENSEEFITTLMIDKLTI